MQVDLTDPVATERAFAEVFDSWSQLDILVVAAGGAITPYARSAASLTTDEDFQRLVDVNLRVVFNCARSAAPLLRASGGGSIVTMASAAASDVGPGGWARGVGRGLRHGQSRRRALHPLFGDRVGPGRHPRQLCRARSLKTSRVVAQSAATGFVDEEVAKTIPLRRQGEPSDIADAVQFFVTPLSAYVTGQVIGVNGGSSMH